MKFNETLFFSEENIQLIQKLSTIPLDKAILKLQPLKHPFATQIIQQLSAQHKIKDKLPTWIETKNILFPPSINLEQSSSEIAAEYKTKITKGKLLIDLTGGFGVDSFYFSKCYESVYYIEKNEELFTISQHNFKQLFVNNITLFNQDCNDFLDTFKSNFLPKDIVIFIDPARRDIKKNKTVLFSESEPNIVKILPKLLSIADTILLKASPMHDLDLALNELRNITQIHVLSIKNECKELLFLIEKTNQIPPKIHAINILKTETETLIFERNDENKTTISYQSPLKYLYEPNASILKAGAFKWVGLKNNCPKIAPNTHLYTSDLLKLNFEGKIFEIIENVNLSKIKNKFPNNQINIICRNYPLTPQEIKQKYKIKDGGELFLICFKDNQQKPVTYLTKRIK